MPLIIVESPTKAKTIKRFLGRQYQVISSYGHVRDLPAKELGVEIKNNFQPKYVTPPSARPIVKKIKEAAQKTDQLILATDHDREGEAIAWHILQLVNGKRFPRYQRIVFHEITPEAIKEALAKPRQIAMSLVEAQQARRILDRLVGYKLSPFLWKKVAKGLSAGRVQSVAVRLIVERENEIKKFKPEEYWSIEALLQKKETQESFKARLIKKGQQALQKLSIKNQKQAEEIANDLKGAEYRIKDLHVSRLEKRPAPPFTTSTLQQAAAGQLGFSAKQTMRLAQQLYEGIELGQKGAVGLITYMRTDSVTLSQQSIKQAAQVIKKLFGSSYLPSQPRYYQTKSKAAQEAHEAIRPTQPQLEPEAIKKYLNKKQYQLYQLIWRRFLACQMASIRLEKTQVDILAKSYLFRANGSVIKFDGWLRVYPEKFKETILPRLEKNELLKLIKLLPEQHFTQPPSRYNEASLVKALEEYGIGRPSTYAPIISTIQDRNYVQKNEQKRFIPTEMGSLVTNLLKKNFEQIVDLGFTAQMEEDLDRIANGRLNSQAMLKRFYQPFEANLLKKYQEVKKQKSEKTTDKKCPRCGKPMVIRWGRFGQFYACSGFPQCKQTEKIIQSLGLKCPKCNQGEIIERKTKKGRTFYGCSRYPQCHFASWDKPSGQRCPKCNQILVEKNKKIVCSSKECSYGKSQKENKPPV